MSLHHWPLLRRGALALALLTGAASCTYTESSGSAGRPSTGASTDTASTSDAIPEDGQHLGALAFAVDGMADQLWYVAFTESGLNIRTGPGTDNESQGRLAAGTQVITTGETADIGGDAWFEITSGALRGWVHSGYLINQEDFDRTSSTTPRVVSTWPAGTALVVAESPGANLRDQPGGEIITELVVGTEVLSSGVETNGWIPVKVGTLDGWVLAALLARTESPLQPFGASSSVTPAPGLSGTNIRSSPDGTIITGIPADESALLTGNVAGDWVEVTYRGVRGWALSDLLVASEDPGTVPPSTATVQKPGDVVAVYLEARLDSLLLTTVPNGEQVDTTGIGTADGWTQVRLVDGTIGWMQTVYLSG